MEIKKCNKCGEVKAIEEFRQGNICRICLRAHIKAYNEQNREHIRAHIKAYNEQNREHLREQKKAYREQNREHIKAYREQNRERIRAQRKAYNEQNRVGINKRRYYLNTSPEELKPALKILITIRNKKNYLKEIKENG
jgi:chemotaxis response regulator CheB